METFITLILIAAAIPLIVSIVVALQPGSQPKGISDYFLNSRELSPWQFLRTSVGYSLQAAAIFLFLFWGFAYGWSALFVPVFWFLGYVLLLYFFRKGWLDEFLHSDEILTMHGFVGRKLTGKRFASNVVRFVASATVIGLGGTMIAEADYAVNFFLDAIALEEGHEAVVRNVGALFLIAYTTVYVLWGGYKAAVRTDLIQVPLAYFSFGIFVLIAVYLVGTNVSGGTASAIASLIGLLYVSFWALRRGLNLGPDDVNLFGWSVPFWLAVLSGLVTVYFFAGHGIDYFSLGQSWGGSSSGSPLLGFGLIGVVALAVTNGIWQLVDLSSLQRLQSLRQSALQDEAGRKSVERGILAAGFESAAVWVLILVVAFLLSLLGAAATSDVSDLLMSSGWLGGVAIALFIFSTMAFALSTIDAFASAIAYVMHFDILTLGGRKSGNRPRSESADRDISNNLASARVATVTGVVAIYLGYIWLRSVVDDQIAAVLYAIYAVQVSALPIFISALICGKVHNTPAIASVIVGAGVAYFSATMSPPSVIPEGSWYVIPPLFVLLASSFVYWGGSALIPALNNPTHSDDREG